MLFGNLYIFWKWFFVIKERFRNLVIMWYKCVLNVKKKNNNIVMYEVSEDVFIFLFL